MKLSEPELRAYVAQLITAEKASNPEFTVSKNNMVGLIDKIGKIVSHDTDFSDRLGELDGEFLPFGARIEEWHEDLLMPTAFDRSGSGALSYKESSYRPTFYSYPIGRQKFAISIPYYEVEKAVHNEAEFSRIISMKQKRLADSEQITRYQLKRELLGKVVELAEEEFNPTSPVAFEAETAYDVNDILVDNASNITKRGIVVKEIKTTTFVSGKTYADAVASGYIINLNLIEALAKPTDTNSGEAFIKAVKKIVEVAKDFNEGNSLNGNCLGASSLTLYIKQGIIPSLEVDTMAGAFNQKMLEMGINQVVVKDFGTADSDCYCVLVDTRGIKLHPTYQATRENFNGDGDFLNLFRHLDFTPYVSRNTFIHVFKEPEVVSNKKASK